MAKTSGRRIARSPSRSTDRGGTRSRGSADRRLAHIVLASVVVALAPFVANSAASSLPGSAGKPR
jgi:hypothetical protein